MKLLKFDDIQNLAELIHDAGYDDAEITIETKIPNRSSFDKLNEDFYYRSHSDDKEKGVPETADIINVAIGDIKFRYILKEEDN